MHYSQVSRGRGDARKGTRAPVLTSPRRGNDTGTQGPARREGGLRHGWPRSGAASPESVGTPGGGGTASGSEESEFGKLFTAAPGVRSTLVLPHGTAGRVYWLSEPDRSRTRCSRFQRQRRADSPDTAPPRLPQRRHPRRHLAKRRQAASAAGSPHSPPAAGPL